MKKKNLPCAVGEPHKKVEMVFKCKDILPLFTPYCKQNFHACHMAEIATSHLIGRRNKHLIRCGFTDKNTQKHRIRYF